MDDPVEFWTLTFRVRPCPRGVPVPARVRRLLKWADALHMECVEVRDADAGETGELRRVIEGLCERVAAQAELLARRAENRQEKTT